MILKYVWNTRILFLTCWNEAQISENTDRYRYRYECGGEDENEAGDRRKEREGERRRMKIYATTT